MEKRVEWIDIAKAVCIVMMIIGHTVEFGSILRNVIFSFHMPLFIILSGYTYNCEKAKLNFFKQTIKDIKQLIIPVVISSCISIALYFAFLQEKNSTLLFESVYNKVQALFWGSGVGVHGAPAIGALWFLISLFWIRLISRVVLRFFSKEKAVYIFLAFSIVGIFVGKKCELPQNLDVTLAMFFFFAIGIIWKDKRETIKKHALLIFIVALVFWTMCIEQGLYIELASRSYPRMYICFLEALAGSYICIQLSQCIGDIKYLNKCLVWIGQQTLLLLCIHHLDSFFKMWWMKENIILSCLCRIVFDFSILFIFVAIRFCYRKVFKGAKK